MTLANRARNRNGDAMKRIGYWLIAAVILTGVAVAQSADPQSESLGDYARTVRKERKPDPNVKKFDNDNLPTTEKISVIGNAGDDTSSSTASQAPANSEQNTAKQAQQNNDEWKTKIAAQKDKADLLARELDVLQREYKLRAAAMYADAGNRMRNETSWDKEDAQYKQQIADKQKTLDDAKKELADMQEEARKAGVPSSARE
jgi:hypothetical protein